jgi:murein L,D-transpeptidase YcbB/YkuD
VRYVADLREGRVEPFKLDPKLFATARDFELNWDELRQQVLENQDMEAFLDKQVPPFYHYKKLKEALVTYREIKANGGWEPVPEGKVLKTGMEDDRLPIIRKRLAATGDLKTDNMMGTAYDEKTVEGVKHFQIRHALAADGVIGNETVETMNVPVDKRIRQIILNMERFRWLNVPGGKKVLAVNIAGFRLLGVANGIFELDMPVIVGKKYHKTPVFSDTIKYLVINPYWNVPNSIAQNEMLPKLKKNSNYLKEKNIRLLNGWDPDAEEVDSTTLDWNSMGKKDIVRYRLRQDPGPGNALGTIKFIFPNKYNVYLHDTPVHSLFERRKRAMSHGCIRVSQPAELAAYILKDEEGGLTLEQVKQTVESGKRTVVPLKNPFPVFILYRTVLVDPESGKINFFSDVYGRDALLEKALF